MLAQLLRLVTGQVRIQVRGAAIEKFLNRCMRDGIALHDTQHVDLDELHTTISIYDFRRLRTSVRRIGCRVHILCVVTAHRSLCAACGGVTYYSPGHS